MKKTQFNKDKDLMKKIKGRSGPLGHVEPQPIPPLDAEPIAGPDGQPMTMAEQAEILRDPRSPLSPMYEPRLKDQQRAIEGQQMDPHARRRASGGQSLASGGHPVRPGPFGGTLPPEAAADPNFRPGVGSQYAANQPGLRTHPQQRRGRGILSEETVEGLEAIKEFQDQAEAAALAEAEQVESKVDEVIEQKAEDELKENLGLDDQMFEELRAAKNELNTPELRKAIEDRCEPLDVIQLIEEGEARQVVPIIREKFMPTFRTMSGQEDLELKRLAFKRSESDIYLVDRFNLMQLTAGLYAVNDQVLPTHLTESGIIDPKEPTAFWRKFKRVISYPIQMLASLSINYSWFDQRARGLFKDLGPLKNG